VITDDRAEAALEYLRDTAKQIGLARGALAYRDASLRRIKSLELLKAEGSLGEREAQAYASDAYKEAIEALENITAEYETIRALREAADLTIRVWQSQQASARVGNV
jgi:hypothetical protein